MLYLLVYTTFPTETWCDYRLLASENEKVDANGDSVTVELLYRSLSISMAQFQLGSFVTDAIIYINVFNKT